MAGTLGSGNRPTGSATQVAIVGTIVNSLSSSLYGDQLYGNDWSVDVDGSASASSVTYLFGTTVNWSIGDKLMLSYRLQIEDMIGNLETQQAAYHVAAKTIPRLNVSGSNVSGDYEFGAAKRGPSGLIWTATTIGVGAVNVWWPLQAATGFRFKAHLSEMQLLNLTRLGLDGLIT